MGYVMTSDTQKHTYTNKDPRAGVQTSCQYTFSAEHAQSRETSRFRVTSSVSTTEPLSTHDVTLEDVDGSLFHIQI